MIKRIGVYDSGLGGLTVVRRLWDCVSDCSITYFGDTARLPYGEKTPAENNLFAWQIISFLLSHRADLIVVACNTSSALALEKMQRRFSVPLVGVISPGVRAAVQASRSGKIGLMATKATVDSKAYEREAEKYGSRICVAVPCWYPSKAGGTDESLAVPDLRDFVHRHDTLILGVPTIPFIPELKKLRYRRSRLDPAEETA